MSQHRNQSTSAMAQEMETILRTTRIDLAGFLALDADTKAARWRQFSAQAKTDLVAQQLTAKYGEEIVDQELIDTAIAHWDAKFGTEPLATEAAVAGALERLAEESGASARTARAAGHKEEATYFQREANAYVKALGFYRAGVRPERTAAGNWLLPSSRAGEAPHLLHQDGGWCCTCAAGTQMHWAAALIIGIEVGGEDVDRYDDAPAVAPFDLAEARRELLARLDRATRLAWAAA